jgi:hypothetical protein
VLLTAFEDLDLEAVGDGLRSLSDAETIALGSTWLLWIAAQGLQTASLIHDLPVRRGVVAFLGPAAVASVVPGPSDLPVRFQMLTSWGRDRADATLSVAAGGLFSIGIKLVMPVIAAVGLLVSGAPVEGGLRTGVMVALAVGGGLVIVGVLLGSERRTAWAGRRLDPLWRVALRRLGRADRDDLGTQLLARRQQALETLRGRWLIAVWGTSLTAAARFALLLMAVRFTGVPEEVLSWPQVFVVYALVQGLTVLPLTAGDAGVSELAFITLLTAAAGSGYVNQITAGVIVFRLLTWLLIIPVGLATLLLWRRSLHPADLPPTTRTGCVAGAVRRPRWPDDQDASPSPPRTRRRVVVRRPRRLR